MPLRSHINPLIGATADASINLEANVVCLVVGLVMSVRTARAAAWEQVQQVGLGVVVKFALA